MKNHTIQMKNHAIKYGMKIYIKIVHYHWFFFNTNENLHITNGKTKYCDIWHAIKNP